MATHVLKAVRVTSVVFAGLVATWLSGCGGVAPRFPADVQTAFATTPMKRMETDQFVIYYPAKRHDETVRFAARSVDSPDLARRFARERPCTRASIPSAE